MIDNKQQALIFLTKYKRNKVILDNARRFNQIVYGARSIQAQVGVLSRQTEDWDIFAKNPRQSARKVEKQLDRQIGFNYFFAKPGMHKGTWKVKGKGYDLKPETKDDEGVADYTQIPIPKPKVKRFHGVMYRTLSEEVSAKKRAIRDKNYAFRKEKDTADLERIKTIQKASKFRLSPLFK